MKPVDLFTELTVSPEQFGAIGDGISDDTVALVAMRNALRAYQDYYGPLSQVFLTVNFGVGKTYKYSDNRWTWGLINLRLLGNGSSFQNVSDSPWHAGKMPLISNRGFDDSSPLGGTFGVNIVYSGKLIHTTIVGSIVVTLVTAAEAAGFTAGMWVIVTSYDQQMSGWPPNARYFDYARVVSSNVGAGTVTLDRALQYAHSESFPEVLDSTGNQNNAGRARIAPIGASDVPFAETLYMENMTFLNNPNFVMPGDDAYDARVHNYLLIQGVYSASLHNINSDCFVPSVVHDVHVYNSHFYVSENDKLVDIAEYDNTVIDTQLSACTGVNYLVYRGGSIGGPHLADSEISFGPVNAMPRRALFDGVAFYRPGVSTDSPTYNQNYILPVSSLVIKNSTFTGGGGDSRPVGWKYVVTLLIDGTIVSVVGSNVVQLVIGTTAFGFSAAENFMTSPTVGGEIGLIKSGDPGTTHWGTVTSITNADTIGIAILTISIAQTIATGDTLACRATPPGGVQLINNTYINYGNPPDIP